MLKSNISGFNLIEILLVIAIIAVIATLSISTYEKKTVANKAEKAALQMQTILQAGAAFYVTKNKWPPNNIADPSFTPYLPFMGAGAALNPWGHSYSISAQGTSGSPERFRVSTIAPDANIANRIMGILPNAQISGTTTVNAEINIPGQASNNEQILIKNVGYKANEDEILVPECPPDFFPRLYVGLGYLRTNVIVNESHGEPPSRIVLGYTPRTRSDGQLLWTIKAIIRQVKSCNILNKQCDEEDQPYGQTWGDKYPVDAGVFFVSACCPVKSKVCTTLMPIH